MKKERMTAVFFGLLMLALSIHAQTPTPTPFNFPSAITLSFNAGLGTPPKPATPNCTADFVNVGAGSTQGSFVVHFQGCYCKPGAVVIAPDGSFGEITGTCSVDTIVPPVPTPTPTATPTPTPPPPPAAAVHTQTCGPVHGTGSVTVPCTMNANDFAVLGVAINDTGCTLVVSGMNRAPHGPALQPGTGQALIFSSLLTSPATSIGVAPSGCSGPMIDAWVDVFTGVSGLDVDAAGVSASGTTVNTPSLTPAAANEAVYNTCIFGGNVSSTSPPWTMDPASNGNVAGWAIPAQGAVSVAYVETAGAGWACAEAAFK